MPTKLGRVYKIADVPEFLLQKDKPWSIVAAGSYVNHHVADIMLYSTNGQLGITHQTDRVGALCRSRLYVNGGFHLVPLHTNASIGSAMVPNAEHIGAAAATVELSIRANGVGCSHEVKTHRELDMALGIYISSARVAVDNTIAMTMTFVRFASLDDPALWACRVELSDVVVSSPFVEVELIAEVNIDTDEWLIEQPHLEGSQTAEDPPSLDVINVASRSSGSSLRHVLRYQATHSGAAAPEQLRMEPLRPLTQAEAKRKASEPPDHPPLLFGLGGPTHRPPDAPPLMTASGASTYRTGRRFVVELTPQFTGTLYLEFIGHHEATNNFGEDCFQGDVVDRSTSGENEPVEDPDAAVCAKVRAQSFDVLMARQAEIMSEFWRTTDISVRLHREIHENRVQQALRYNTFVLFCNGYYCGQNGLTRCGLSCPGAPMTVSLQSYLLLGLYYSFTHPILAQQLIKHLYSLLPYARAHAERMGIHGAVYPHRTVTGEPCGSFSLANCGRYQITADIAHFLFVYLDVIRPAPGAPPPLEEELTIAEILLDTARVWPQIGAWHDAHSLFCIDDICGPDEYNGLVADNFYTNLVARKHMERTHALITALRRREPEAVEILLEALRMDETEFETLRNAAKAMTMHRDDKTGVYFSHREFDEDREWPHADELQHPLPANYHPSIIFRHKVCQIPEVLLGLLLYSNDFDKVDLRRNLEYYEPLCTHDHPLSLGIISCAKFSAYGDFGGGTDEFLALCYMNIDNANATPEGGVKLNIMAAAWFVIVFGIGGLRIADSNLHFSPSLPVGWERCVFTVHWAGCVIRVEITSADIDYSLLSGRRCRFLHCGNVRVTLDARRPAFRIARAISHAVSDYFDGVVLSLESLISNIDELNFRAWFEVLSKYFDEIERRSRFQSEPRVIPPLTFDEFIERIVYQRETEKRGYTGLDCILRERGITLPLGNRADSELTDTRCGLANSKLGCLHDMLAGGVAVDLVTPLLELITDLYRNGLRVAVVSFTRSMRELLDRFPRNVVAAITVLIDGVEAREKEIKGRPSADIAVEAAAKMHLRPERCLVFSTHLDAGISEAAMARFPAWINVTGTRKRRGTSRAPGSCTGASSAANGDPMSPTSVSRGTDEHSVIHLTREELPTSTYALENIISDHFERYHAPASSST